MLQHRGLTHPGPDIAACRKQVNTGCDLQTDGHRDLRADIKALFLEVVNRPEAIVLRPLEAHFQMSLQRDDQFTGNIKFRFQRNGAHACYLNRTDGNRAWEIRRFQIVHLHIARHFGIRVNDTGDFLTQFGFGCNLDIGKLHRDAGFDTVGQVQRQLCRDLLLTLVVCNLVADRACVGSAAVAGGVSGGLGTFELLQIRFHGCLIIKVYQRVLRAFGIGDS